MYKKILLSLLCILLIGTNCFAAPFSFRDEFNTAKNAGSVNNSASEPGVGTRTVTDTENKLSIANGALTFSGGKASPGWGDPGIWLPAVTRATGKMAIFEVTPSLNNKDIAFGFDNNTATSLGSSGFSLSATGILNSYVSPGTVPIGTFTANQSCKYYVALRATGAFLFASGYGYTYPTLLYVTANDNTASLYPAIVNYNMAFTSDMVRLPSTLWLPSPIVSDSFATTFGTSNGLGHAETTGLGSGGAGKTWSGTTFSVSGGKAINTPTPGTSLVDANASTFEAAGGIYGWIKYGNNTIENDGNALKITYADHVRGAYEYLSNAKDLSSDLTVGTWYRIDLDAKVNAGSSVNLAVGYSTDTIFGSPVTNTDFATKIGTFRGENATLSTLSLTGMGAGEIVWLDNWTLKPLTLSELISTVETNTIDSIVTASLANSPAGTQAGICMAIDSASDPKYGLFAYHDGTNCKLDKLINGTWTNVISAAATWADNAEIRLIRDGQTYRLYYNNAQVGTTQTIADVGGSTKHGIFSTYSGNQIDNFTVYARGTSSEYNDILNALMQADGGSGGFSWSWGGWGF